MKHNVVVKNLMKYSILTIILNRTIKINIQNLALPVYFTIK